LLAASGVVLSVAWFRQPGERAGIVGVASILAAVLSLAVGMGWGRSGESELAGLQGRYVTLAAPTLLGIYFVFSCYGPGMLKRLVPMILFAGSCVLLWPNVQAGWSAGREVGKQSEAFDRDLASGTPLFRLVRRHTPFLHPSQETLYDSLRMLREARIGRFRLIQDDPPFKEIDVERVPAEVRLARWNDGHIDVIGPDPWIRFDLPSPSAVCGIKLRYSHASPDGAPARFKIAWRRPGQLVFPPEQQYGNWNLPTGPNHSMTVWVDDVISQIRIQPDNRPCAFALSELTLLVAPRSGDGRP
jgi:hypothetical protein